MIIEEKFRARATFSGEIVKVIVVYLDFLKL